MPSPKDITGKRFGRLVVLSLASERGTGKRRWLCRCDCGNEKVIQSTDLATGNTRSCGCFMRESVAKRKTKHGLCRRGHPKPVEYSIWKGMVTRCADLSSANYGGRGISVCDRWRKDFLAFLRDMGPRPSPAHSIDRIDVNGNYEPSNCRWATQQEQQNNRRDNHHVTYRGTRLTLSELSRQTGVQAATIRKRLDRGWSAEQAADLPVTPISPFRQYVTPNGIQKQKSATRPIERRNTFKREEAE